MGALQVSLDPFGTEHAAVESKLVPRFETDHFVIAHLQLDAALLAAEAAGALAVPPPLRARREPDAGHVGAVRSVAFDDLQRVGGNRGHDVTARTTRDRWAAARPTHVPGRDRTAHGGSAGKSAGSDRRPGSDPSRRQ